MKRQQSPESSKTVKKKRLIEYHKTALPGLPAQDADTLSDQILDQYPVELHEIIAEHWSDVRTRYRLRRVNRVMSSFNFRLQNMHVDENELKKYVKAIYRLQKSAFKVQFYVSSILRNIEDESLRLFQGSPNFQTLIPKPMVIANVNDLAQSLTTISLQDFNEIITQERPNTKWVALGVLTFHVTAWKIDSTLIGSPGASKPLPQFVKKNKNILTLTCDSKGRPYKEGSCFFVALASFMSNYKIDVVKLANQLYETYQEKKKLTNFKGFVKLDDFDVLERMFNIKVNLYTLKQRNTKKGGSFFHAQTIRIGLNDDPKAKVMHCDLQGVHLSLIKNIQSYAKQFQCNSCRLLFTTPRNMELHKTKGWCWTEPKPIYQAGNYDVDSENVFEQLYRKGIRLNCSSDRFDNHFCTLDFETYNQTDKLQVTAKVSYDNRLEMLCGAVASTLDPSNDEGAFFGRQEGEDAEGLLRNMFDHLSKLQRKKEGQRTQQLKYLFDELRRRIEFMMSKRDDYESDSDQSSSSESITSDDDQPSTSRLTEPTEIYIKQELKELRKIEARLLEHCAQLVVFGFNSARFDWKLIRNELIKTYGEQDKDIITVIKDKRGYQLLKLGNLCLRDCSSLLAPGISLRAFLKSQNTNSDENEKLEFPHSWLYSISQLQQQTFPPIHAFYNDLKGETISTEDYIKLKAIFDSKCQTMYDYMRIYNIRDVAPLVSALEKLRDFWQNLGVCMMYDGISLPGLSHKYLHRKLKRECSGLIFWLPAKTDEAVCQLIDKGMQGGFSCIFTRYHEKDVTKIRSDDGRTCKTCVGFDANSMYLKCLSSEMPVSIPALWSKDTDTNKFKRKRLVAPGSSSAEVQFCLYLERHEHPGYFVRHRYNGKQLRIGNFSLDAAVEEIKVGYLFMGCYYHKHRLCDNIKSRAQYGEEEIVQKENETKERVKFFEALGFRCIVEWECSWRRKPKPVEFKEFLNDTYHLPKVNKKGCTQADLIRYILNEEVYGLVTGVDIYVPRERFDYFSDMAPLFEHRMISEGDLCPYVKELHEKANIKFQQRKTLVGGFVSKNATYTTPLLRYLLLKGCRVENIQSFIQYKPYKAFEGVANFLTQKRIECEQDVNTKVLADFYKLIGNSLYGKNLEAKSKFLNVRFIPETSSARFVLKPTFKYLDEFQNGWSEVGMLKKRYKTNTLRVVGLFVLQYSKEILLKFLYDFIDNFVSRLDYDILSVDTDCYYLALSGASLDELVPESRKNEFIKYKSTFLANPDDPVDRRALGKWKLEWQGIGYIGLAPKLTYGYTVTDETIQKAIETLPECEHDKVIKELTSKNKWSAKGVQKRNKLTYLDYLYVLQNQTKTKLVENKGLRWYKNAMRSYSIFKTGLTARFYKRKLLGPDGIRTECLDS